MPKPDDNPKHRTKAKRTARTSTQKLRRERLENLGLLATRVAHDLNNMLGPMKMAVSQIRPSVTDGSVKNLLTSVESTVGRVTALVRQVLEYADGLGGQFQRVPIDQLLEEVVLFARMTFPQSIRVERRIPSDLWWIDANLSQIHQVLLNLCVNARDAMEQGGLLRLSAENRRLDAAAARRIPDGRAGAFLVLQIDDTGTGFSPEILTKVWEPFMTAKKFGRGSGLGLSTVRTIVAHHEGFIELRTAIGKGSSFRIYLPAIEISVASPPTMVSLPTQTPIRSSSRVRVAS